MRPSTTTPDTAVPSRPARPLVFADCLKDPVVEEPVDLLLHRRLAFQLLKPIVALDLPVTPTQITLASGVVGLAAGFAYYRAGTAGPVWYLVGSLLLLASIVFDCLDGMLARVRHCGTHFGMLLDGMVDLWVGIAVWYGIAHSCVQPFASHVWAWPLAITVLLSIVVHCAFYDQVKNDFVRYSSPRQAAVAAASSVEEGAFARAMGGSYRAVYGTIARALGGGDLEALERSEPERFREVYTPTMRLCTHLGLGTHLAVMYVACLVGVLLPGAPFVVANVVVVGALNTLMVVTVLSRRQATRRLRASIG